MSRASERHDRLLAALGLPVPEPEKYIPDLMPQHQLVLDHWFKGGCLSKKRACEAAGFAPGYAPSIFKRPEVLAEIDRRRVKLYQKAEITEERIIEEFSKIAFSNLGDLLEIQSDGSAWLDMSAITDDQKAALSEYHVESYQERGDDDDNPGHTVKKARIKFHDKQAALLSLARIKGMLKDKLEINVGLSLSDKVQMRRERLAVSRDTVIEGEIIK